MIAEPQHIVVTTPAQPIPTHYFIFVDTNISLDAHIVIIRFVCQQRLPLMIYYRVPFPHLSPSRHPSFPPTTSQERFLHFLILSLLAYFFWLACVRLCFLTWLRGWASSMARMREVLLHLELSRIFFVTAHRSRYDCDIAPAPGSKSPHCEALRYKLCRGLEIAQLLH
jgi:hypothetical protein